MFEDDPLTVLGRLLAEHRLPETAAPTPLPAGAVGFLSYDLVRGLEKLPEQTEDDLDVPDLFFGFYDSIITWDHGAGEATISYAESHDQALVGDKTLIFRLIDKDMYWHMNKDAQNLVNRGVYLISEGANMPTVPEGVEIFLNNDVLYGLGKAANAGGVAVSGLAFAEVRARECRYLGLADAALDGIQGVSTDFGKAVGRYTGQDSWDGLLSDWRRNLEGLAARFLQGEAAVSPQRGACDYCGLQPLCRVDIDPREALG